MTKASLSVSTLSVRYGKRLVLDDLALDRIDGGNIIALVGPNGAGKSTLLRALAGLVSARGSATLNDIELVGLAPAVRSRYVGFMPQTLPSGVSLTVLEGVLSARNATAVDEQSAAADAGRHAVAALERIGIEHLALQSLDQLSGGERQLAGLAQAIVRQPLMLLLDEPTSALDLGHQETVMTLVRAIADEGRIVIVVVHDLNLATRWADRVVVMRRGAVVASGPPTHAITAATIADVYGVAARIERCSQGRALVIVDGVVSNV